MVSIIRRMAKLKSLLKIRVGPGAALLPSEVTKIHMEFASKNNDGHFGPRKFWQMYMPRLKYYNPRVSMTINRVQNQEGPALMTIHFTDSSSAASTEPATSSTTQAHTSSAPVSASTSMPPTERTATINMKHRHSTEILSQFLAITKAKPVEPTARDLEIAQDVENRKRQTEIDSKLSAQVNAEKKRQEAMLAAARGQVVEA